MADTIKQVAGINGLKGIKQLQEVNSVVKANTLLQKGWQLLHVRIEKCKTWVKVNKQHELADEMKSVYILGKD